MASAAKRQAVADAAAEADASAARTAPCIPISVHLTPYAPVAGRKPINHPSRWATFYGRTPSQVVRATLAKVRLAPGAARVLVDDAGVNLMGPIPPELAKLESEEAAEAVPFAVFWDGVTGSQVQAELDALVAAGWRPGSLEGAP